MSEPDQPATVPASTSKTGRTMRRVLVAAAFAATFVAGGLAGSILPAAAQMAADAGAMHEGMDGGMGMGMGGHGGGHHGGMRMMMMAHFDRALDQVGASADQKARIHAILKASHDQMQPMHEHMAAAHKQFAEYLLGPTVNRAGLEQLREQHMADADQASKTMVRAFADAAEVLTPDQRARLATLLAEHCHHRPDHAD